MLQADVLLTAAAGTGKTHALVERYLAALTAAVDPPEPPAARVATLVAITFTVAAAAEMRSRVEASLRRRMEGWSQGSAGRRAWGQVLDLLPAARISTIHALCATLLREHARAAQRLAGVPPGFDVLDEGEAAVLRHEAVARTLERVRNEGGARWGSYLALTAVLGSSRVAEMVGSLVERRVPLPPGPAPGGPPGEQDVGARDRLVDLATEVLATYNRTKRERGALDFDDLETAALALVEDAVTGGVVRAGIRHVLVDEFQDVSPLQLRLILALRGTDHPSRRALFAVGDPKQAIYAFRGARGALDGLRRALALQEGRLARTRRFADPLASFVNAFGPTLLPPEAIGATYEPIEPAVTPTGPDPAHATSVEVLLLEGPRRAAAGGRSRDIAAMLAAKFEDPTRPGPIPREGGVEAEEARGLARRVQDLLAEGRTVLPWRPTDPPEPHPLGPGDIAFLLSYRRHEDVYAHALREVGLPVVVHPGTGFHDRQEVRDVVGLLRVVARDGDDVALYGLLRSPFFGFSDEEIAAWYLPFDEPPPLGEALRAESQRDPEGPAATAARWIHRWRALQEEVTPTELLHEILEEVGAWGPWCDDERGGRSVANVQKLLDLIGELPARGIVGLGAIAQHLEELAEVEGDEPEAGVELAGHAINLMTVHAAKGLEFPVVVVPGLQRQWPRVRGPLVVSPSGEIAIDPTLFGPPVFPDGGPTGPPAAGEEGVGEDDARGAAPEIRTDAYGLVRDALERDGEMEARRLFYVALTRARDHLVLSGVLRRTPDGGAASASREPWRRWLNEAFAVEELPEVDHVTPQGWRFRRLSREPAGVGPPAPDGSSGAGSGEAAGPPAAADADGPPQPASWSPVASAAQEHAILARCETLLYDLSASPVSTEAPLELVDPDPPVGGGGRFSFSVEELEVFAGCERAGWARMRGEASGGLEAPAAPAPGAGGKTPSPGGTPSDPARWGDLFHRLMARSASSRPEVLALLEEEVPGLTGEALEREADRLAAQVQWALAQDLGTPGSPPLREEPMVWVQGEGSVRGRMDAVFLEASTPLVEDYKTGEGVPRDGASVRRKYRFQLLSYALAVRRGSRPVHLRVLHPPTRGTWAWEATPRELDTFAGELQAVLARAVEVATGRRSAAACGRAGCPACGRASLAPEP